jgi:REP element-mobilizing transposase RayT
VSTANPNTIEPSSQSPQRDTRMRYRRANLAGGTYFFTVNLAERDRTVLVDQVGSLRSAMREVLARHPFYIDAMVVLPDHLHALRTLPAGDCDYPMRWASIEGAFSRRIPPGRAMQSKQCIQGRTRHLAKALLGASDSGRTGLRTTCGLHPLQSGETRLRPIVLRIGRIRVSTATLPSE